MTLTFDLLTLESGKTSNFYALYVYNVWFLIAQPFLSADTQTDTV